MFFSLFVLYRETVYGNEKGNGGSQPPMMLVFHGKYTKMDPGWHIRNLGEVSTNYQVKKKKKKKKTVIFKIWTDRPEQTVST